MQSDVQCLFGLCQKPHIEALTDSCVGLNPVLCVCAGGSPGWPRCCGFVPGSTGEEQLEGDGLEVGPQWVRPVQYVSREKSCICDVCFI